MNRRSFILGAGAGALTVVSARAAAAVNIAEVLPFAGADNVRIEVRMGSDAAIAGLELAGRIEPWSGGPVLWAGAVGQADVPAGGTATVTKKIGGLRPRLWSPLDPQLYRLTVTARAGGAVVAEKATRLGFRSFESRDGRFWLNGRPIFLRGNSINPPGRGVPEDVGMSREFAETYLRDLQRRHVNLVRVDSDLWQDICDELGLLVFHGRYGLPRGATKEAPPSDVAAAIARYQSEYFAGYQKHPSVIIAILSNEAPHRGAEGEAFGRFFDAVHAVLREWDPNRLYIGNAGFGAGRGGDINDAHPYWGWYGGDFLTNYARLQDRGSGRQAAQPWTFTECVGAYTTPEGRFSVAGKLLGTSLTWTGHCAEQAEKALRYQAFLARQFIEIQRRLRPANPNLAGIMPFTHIWFNWAGIGRFEEMKPKPVADQLAESYQPVLLSWELWTPHVYAGATVRAVAHLVNDADDRSDLRGATLAWRLVGPTGRAEATGQAAVPDLPYYAVRALPVELRLPSNVIGRCTLEGRVIAGGREISRNRADLAVFGETWARGEKRAGVKIYDPAGKTTAALARLGITCEPLAEPEDTGDLAVPLIIGELAWDASLSRRAARLGDFVRGGGRVLVLRPDAASFATDWLGAKLVAAARNGMWINLERPAHPVFTGLTHWDFEWWSDYTGWQQGRAELPRIHPATVRFSLDDVADLANVAVLANCDVGLRSIALCEVFAGQGSALLCGFDLVARAGRDPVADRFLANLVCYAGARDAHEARPLVEREIVWGDFANEHGIVVTSQQGLVANQDGEKPRGRRMLGAFRYGGPTNGYVIDPLPDKPEGWGRFFVQIPSGRKTMLTRVENPRQEALPLAITLNGRTTRAIVGGGETATITTPLPWARALDVTFAASKQLVLLATWFE